MSNTQGARFTLGLVAREEATENESDEASAFVFGDAAQRSNQSKKLSQAITEDAEAAQAFFQYMIQLAADNAAVSVDLLRLVVTLPTTSNDDDDATQTTTAWLDCITAACKKLIPDKKKRKQNFIMGVISKPAATCLAYNNDDDEKKNILVVDMDGDAALQWTVLEYEGGVYSKQQSDNNNLLPEVSGPVVVQLLANFVATQFERQCKIPRGEVMERKKANTKLVKEAEKQLLSGKTTMSFLMDGLYDGMDCNVNVSKPRWDMMTGKLLRQVEAALQQPATTSAVDAVLMSGAWASLLKATLVKLFGEEKLITAGSPPEEAVVLGCAKQAGYCAAKSKKDLQPILTPTVSVPVVSPISIGLSDDVILIPQGTPLPAKTTHTTTACCKLYQLTPQKIELAELQGDGTLLIELSAEGTLSIGRLGEEAPLVTIK